LFAFRRIVVKSGPPVSDKLSGRMAEMDMSLIEPLFKMVITLEFAFLAVIGLTLAVHLVMMDSEIRNISSKQHEMILAVKAGLEARMAEKEEKKLRILNAIMNPG
jgi:hypothetical protein